jgi:dihydroxyacetone kinase-like protein
MPDGVRLALIRALRDLPKSADELSALDRALGDGDLGTTVSAGAYAVAEVLDASPEATPRELFEFAGEVFGAANPSTFSSLVRAALRAVGRSEVVSTEPSDRTPANVLGEILAVAAASVRAKGQCEPGDKTVLDALLASQAELEGSDVVDGAVLKRMATAAEQRTTQLSAQESKRGRAAWLRDRSKGHADPGSVAYIRFLEALAREL